MRIKFLKDGICPDCEMPLYEDPFKNKMYCRGRVSGCRFSMSKDKFRELTSREAFGFRHDRGRDEVEENQSALNNL